MLKMSQWLSGDWLLSQFGKNLGKAKRNYKAFVEGVDPWSLENPGKSPVGGFILGCLDFVNWVKWESAVRTLDPYLITKLSDCRACRIYCVK